MANGRNVVVTGGAGYAGSAIVRRLHGEGYSVTCVDNLRWGGESTLGLLGQGGYELHKLDIRDHEAVDHLIAEDPPYAVIHLAAIVGDPACKLEPEVATATNWDASVNLLESALRNGVERFVFASTCSNYGKTGNPDTFLDEDSPLAPVSLYAELKVKFEQRLLKSGQDGSPLSPTALRFATVYGLSPRMRFDLTVNEFTKELALGRQLDIYGEQFWRPYCHVADFGQAVSLTLAAPEERVRGNVFNVGATSENYTKGMLAEKLRAAIPEGEIRFVQKEEDPRDYRVSFDKITNTLGFSPTRTVDDGIREVRMAVKDRIIRNPDDPVYYNIPYAR